MEKISCFLTLNHTHLSQPYIKSIDFLRDEGENKQNMLIFVSGCSTPLNSLQKKKMVHLVLSVNLKCTFLDVKLNYNCVSPPLLQYQSKLGVVLPLFSPTVSVLFSVSPPLSVSWSALLLFTPVSHCWVVFSLPSTLPVNYLSSFINEYRPIFVFIFSVQWF